MEKSKEDTIRGMLQSIGDWYKNEYPDDKDVITEYAGIYFMSFADLLCCLESGYMPHCNDSMARETIFERLSELTGKDYEYFYDLWIKAEQDSLNFTDRGIVVSPALWF